MEQLHASEKLNERSVYLRILKKLWIVPAAILAAACIFGGIYLLITLVIHDTRQYQKVSKLYIEFAQDEQGKAYDYYNGATWTDLLSCDPQLYEAILKELPGETQAEGIERIKNTVKAEILTDIRLMTVTVTDSDRDRTAQMAAAVNHALVQFGKDKKEFDEIRLLSEGEASLVVIGSRLRNALLLGAFLGGLFSFLLLWLWEILDDAVYVPEEAERRYGLPVVEIRVQEEQQLPEVLTAEYRKDRELAAGGEAVTEIPAEYTVIRKKQSAAPEKEAATPVKQEHPEELHGKAVFLKLTWGKRMGTQTERRINELRKQGVDLRGIILTDADADFLKKYYRL